MQVVLVDASGLFFIFIMKSMHFIYILFKKTPLPDTVFIYKTWTCPGYQILVNSSIELVGNKKVSSRSIKKYVKSCIYKHLHLLTAVIEKNRDKYG